MSALSRPRKRQLYRIDTLYPPGRPMKAAMLKETIKGTFFNRCGNKDASSIRLRDSTYLAKCCTVTVSH